MSVTTAALLAMIVLASALVGFGITRLRAPADSPIGPQWPFAWAVLITMGLCAELSGRTPGLGILTHALAPVFAALLLAGAIRFVGRRPLAWLGPLAVAVGVARGVLTAGGWTTASGLVSLAFEPTTAFAAAWLIATSKTDLCLISRVLMLGLCGIGLLEVWEAVAPIAGIGEVFWAGWIALSIPLAIVQLRALTETTEESRAQSVRALEEASARLDRMSEDSGDIFTEVGPDGRVSWVSANSKRVLGYAPEQMIGLHAAEAVDLVSAEIEREIEPGSDLASMELGEYYEGVHSVVDAEGNRRWFENHVSTSLSADGHPRAISVGRDVTARVLADKERVASERRFRQFTLLSNDYCYQVTAAAGRVSRLLEGDLEKISGYSAREAAAIGFEGLLHEDDVAPGRERLDRLLKAGGESRHTFRIVTKAGDVRWISEVLRVERDDAGVRFYGAARDVTDERRLQEAVRASQKLDSLGVMAGGVAHDFNNLLTSILGRTEVAMQLVDDDSPARGHLEAAIDAAEHASDVTQKLLAYAGSGGVERRALDVTACVRAIPGLVGSAGASRVDLLIDFEDDLPPTWADPGELHQIVMNLVMNAVEACGNGGKVRISANAVRGRDVTPSGLHIGDLEADVTYVALAVADSGVGIHPDSLERIFDPFYSTKAAGRGLGLAAVLGIVRSLGGALSVRTRSEAGATFCVYLRTAAESEASASGSKSVASAVKRILVIDDDERILALLHGALERAGYEVVTAASGEAGVAEAKAAHFDLVVLDAMMPGMSGARTFQEIRGLRADQRVLMASGYDAETASHELLDGLAGFIAKPFRPSELVVRIEELLAR